MRKALVIGGTGTISAAVVRRLDASGEWEVWVLNRGRRKPAAGEHIHPLTADMADEAAAAVLLDGMAFDTVCEFIGFEQERRASTSTSAAPPPITSRRPAPSSRRARRWPIPTGCIPGTRSPARMS